LADQIDLIENEGQRLLAVASQDVDREVPQYPGWMIRDLLSHTGSVLGRTTLVCRDRLQDRPTSPKMAEGDDALKWFATRLEEVCAILKETDPGIPVWGFGPSPNVGFWINRMLIEVGIHRWDTEQAFGRPLPLLDDVSVAGLDEFPAMWMPRLGELSLVELLATDLGRTWTFGHGEDPRKVRATGSDLYLRLMSRPSPANFPGDWIDAVDALDPPPR
jgi:uncharacterized protein (TIGR03083 family)